MKDDIHPKWFPEAKVTCACGNSFVVGASVAEYSVDVCSMCHPFFTGQMKYLDTAGRVEAFKARQAASVGKTQSKTEKRRLKKIKKMQEELERPESLEQLRKEAGKK